MFFLQTFLFFSANAFASSSASASSPMPLLLPLPCPLPPLPLFLTWDCIIFGKKSEVTSHAWVYFVRNSIFEFFLRMSRIWINSSVKVAYSCVKLLVVSYSGLWPSKLKATELLMKKRVHRFLSKIRVLVEIKTGEKNCKHNDFPASRMTFIFPLQFIPNKVFFGWPHHCA